MKVGGSFTGTMTLTHIDPTLLFLSHISLADYPYDEESGMYWVYSDGVKRLMSEEELAEFISVYNKKIDLYNENLRRHAEEVNEHGKMFRKV